MTYDDITMREKAKAQPFEFNTCPLEGKHLLEASAGTGKTWSIAAMYTRLIVEKKLNVRDILVVTFSEAARDELATRIRGRILETFEALSRGDEDSSDPVIRHVTENIDEFGGKENVLARLELAYRSSDEAAIYTIHGYCQRALAMSAFSAGQPLAGDVITDETKLITEAVNDFWRRMFAPSVLPAPLAAWFTKQGISPTSLVTILQNRMNKPLARLEGGNDFDGEITRFPELYDAFVSAYKELCSWYPKIKNETERFEEIRKTLNGNSYRAQTFPNAIGALGYMYRVNEPDMFLSKSDTIKNLEYLTKSSVKGQIKKKAQEMTHPVFDVAQAFEDARKALEKCCLELKAGFYRKFFGECPEHLARKRKDLRAVTFSSMISLVYEALNPERGESAKNLSNLLFEQHPVAMIDEFQDTDAMQCGIFSAIYDGRPDATVYLVGDPKQSIYGFRGADIYSYLDVFRHIDRKNRHTMGKNFRSVPALVDSVNRLFSLRQNPFMNQEIEFEEVEANSKEVTGQPVLKVWKLPSEGDLSADKLLNRSISATADEIAKLLKGKASCPGLEQVEPKDICVLVTRHVESEKVRDALYARGIASVTVSQQNVFATAESLEIETILRCILEPEHTSVLKAALSTELMGRTAKEILDIDDDPAVLSDLVSRLSGYRKTWFEKGVGFAVSEFMAKEGVPARVLTLENGERRMTNLAHITELLYAAEIAALPPMELFAWIESQRGEKAESGTNEIRLESDSKLVKIMTAFASKGLEFPVVFCPTLYRLGTDSRSSDVSSYHDNEQGWTFKLDKLPEETPEEEAVARRFKAVMKTDELAGDMRLIYVALTRASRLMYLTVGAKGTKAGDRHSSLNWLVRPEEEEFLKPQDYAMMTSQKSRLIYGKASDIETGWNEFGQECHDDVSVDSLPEPGGVNPEESAFVGQEKKSWECATFRGEFEFPWRLSSFTSLTKLMAEERESASVRKDRDDMSDDETETVTEVTEKTETDTSETMGVLRLPKGANTGNWVHSVFEYADFSDEASWDKAAQKATAQYMANEEEPETLVVAARRMLEDVTGAPLPNGGTLSDITMDRRLSEWPFCLSKSRFSASALNGFASRFGVPGASFGFFSAESYLRGFVDLVFEADGKYWVADWKSNYLGESANDYGPESLEAAMTSHAYHWQYLFYMVALVRHLKLTVKDFDYDTHVGGVYYFFIRGMREDWKNPDGTATGIYSARPSKEMIEALDEILSASDKEGA